MLRLILLGVLLLLVLVGGLAVALFHFYGWKGMLAFPFIILLLVWLGKAVIGKLIKGFALSLFSMKSRVLHGASMTVHSIAPVPKPPEPEMDEEEEDEDDSAVPTVPESETSAKPANDQGDAESDDVPEPEEPKDYFAVDLTITPQESNQDRVWEPGEFILTSEKIRSLEELEDGEKEVGSVEDIRIWDGSQFGPDDVGKYPGVQRLKVTFSVKPGTSKAWLHYYSETIGLLELPAWKPVVER
jgi:hypothetical protein